MLHSLGLDHLLPDNDIQYKDGRVGPSQEEAKALFWEALRARTMMAFVGSGVSRSLGGPSWRELVDAVHEVAGMKKPPEKLEKSRFLTVLETAKAKIDEDGERGKEFESLLKDLFGSEGTKAADTDANPISALLDLEIERFCTTNYDRAIEDTIELRRERQRAEGSRVQRAALSFTALHGDTASQVRFAAARPSDHTSTSAAKVWHLHGDWASPETLVLTRSDYDGLYRLPGAALTKDLIRTALASGPVLFVGYSLSDQELDDLLQIQRVSHAAYEGLQPLFGIFREYEDNAHEIAIRNDYWERFNLVRISYKREFCSLHTVGPKKQTKGWKDAIEGCDDCHKSHGRSVSKCLHELKAPIEDLESLQGLQPARSFSGVPDFKTTTLPFAEWESDGWSGREWALPTQVTKGPSDGLPNVTLILGRAGTSRSLCAETLVTNALDRSKGKDLQVIRWDFAESGDVTSLADAVSNIGASLIGSEVSGEFGAQSFDSAFECLKDCPIIVLVEGLEHLLWQKPEGAPSSPLAHSFLSEIYSFAYEVHAPQGRIVVTTESIPEPLLKLDVRRVPEAPPQLAQLAVQQILDRSEQIGREDQFNREINDVVALLRGGGHALQLALMWLKNQNAEPIASKSAKTVDPSNARNTVRQLRSALAGNPGLRRDRMFALLTRDRSVTYRALLSVMSLAFVAMRQSTAMLTAKAVIEAGLFNQDVRDDQDQTYDEDHFITAWNELIQCGVLCTSTTEPGAYVINDFARRQVLNQAQYADSSAGRSHRPLTGTTAPGPPITAGSKGAKIALEAVDALLDATEAVFRANNKVSPKQPAQPVRADLHEYLRVALSLIRSRFEARSATPTVELTRLLKRELRILNASRKLAPQDGEWYSSQLPTKNCIDSDATFTLGELGWLCNDIAIGLYATGRMDQAEAMYTRGHEVHRMLSFRVGQPAYQTQSRLHFAHLAVARGDLTNAKFFLDRTESLIDQLADPHKEDYAARIAGYRAIIAHIRDERGIARQLFHQALNSYLPDRPGQVRNRRLVAKFLTHLAYLELEFGELEASRLHLADAIGMTHGSSASDLAVLAHVAHSNLCLTVNEISFAAEHLKTARRIAEASNLRRMMVEVNLQRAKLHMANGELDQAWDTALRMLRTATSTGLMLRQTRALELLGEICAVQFRFTEAGVFLQIAKDRAARQGYFRRVTKCDSLISGLEGR